MNLTSQRTIDPTRVTGGFGFDEADITKAFFDQADPDEDLFYQLFSPAWTKMKVSEQFHVLAQVAELVENEGRAAAIKVTMGPAVPK